MRFTMLVLNLLIVFIYLSSPQPVTSSRSLRTADASSSEERVAVSIKGMADIVQSILARITPSKSNQNNKNSDDHQLHNDHDLNPALPMIPITSGEELIQVQQESVPEPFGLVENTTLDNLLSKLFRNIQVVKNKECYNLMASRILGSAFQSVLRSDDCLVVFSVPDCDRQRSQKIEYLTLGRRPPDVPCSEEMVFGKASDPVTVTKFKRSTPSVTNNEIPTALTVKTYSSRHPFSPEPVGEQDSDEPEDDYVLPEMSWASNNGNGMSRPKPTKPTIKTSTRIPPELAFPEIYTPIEAISDTPIGLAYPKFEACKAKCTTKDQFGVTHEACPHTISYSPCPNGATGSTGFECVVMENGENNGRLDFSRCNSVWVADLGNSTTQGTVIQTSAATNLLHTLEANLQASSNGSAKFYGHEIEGLLDIIDRVVVQTNKQNLTETEMLAETSLNIFGSLASDADSWNQLDETKRARAATKLFNTIETTMLGVTKTKQKSSDGTSGYSKTFSRSNDLKIVVGTLRRPGFGQGPATEADAMAESDLQLPGGWQELVPGTGDIQFVRMKMATNLVNNMIPQSQNENGAKSVNSPLNSFTVANSNGTVALKFKGTGIRITFQHAAEAWGSEETTSVPRKLHDGEQAKAVLGSGVCVYWDTQKSNWSSDGCLVVESSRSVTVCECQHLTAFAVLMNTHKYTGRDIGLTVLTIILCSLSIICLLTTIIILKTLRTVRNPRSSVTVHLCICLLLGNLLILTLMDRNNFALPNVFCAFTGMITHFVFLSAFGWMAVEGYIVYKMVVDVFDTGIENKIRLRLFAYGAPCVIVAIVLVVHLFSANPSYGGDLYCWLEGSYIWAFIVPVILVTAVNILVLIIALTKAYHKNNSTAQVKQSAKKSRNMILGTLSLTCILGITWIFGLLLTASNAHVSVVGAYLFTIFNASQGILIFIFHCWMNKQVRKAVDRRISTWTSGSYPSGNSRSQPANSASYSAAKRTESTRGSKSSGSDRRETQNLEDADQERETLPTVNLATHPNVNVQNGEAPPLDKTKDDGISDMGSTDSEQDSESEEDELNKPSEPVMLKYTSAEA